MNAVKTHGIKRSGVQPAVIRMLLDADVPKEDLASLEFLISASGPLDPETRDEFEAHYGIPVKLAYGATEFAGSLCAWTPEMDREFGASKRNSVGRALPDTGLRIVDQDTGAELPVGERGLLEAKITSISEDWIRTTDIASIDEDGFVTLHGRADGAINRGGFKILPETVRRVLISHPAVRDACVVGVPDARLGQVPFAAIEAVPGEPVPVRGRAQGPGPSVAAGLQRARRVRRRRRTAAQSRVEGEPPRRRRALRGALKQVVPARVLAVVVHGRFAARRQQRPWAFEPLRDLGRLDAGNAVRTAGDELDQQQPRIGRGRRRHLPHVVMAVFVVHAVQTAVVDDQREVGSDALLAEPGDIGLLEPDIDAVRRRLRPCLVDRLLHVVDAGDLPAVSGQVDGVVAGAATDVEGLRRRRGVVTLDQVRQARRQRMPVPRREAQAVEGSEQQLPRPHVRSSRGPMTASARGFM